MCSGNARQARSGEARGSASPDKARFGGIRQGGHLARFIAARWVEAWTVRQAWPGVEEAMTRYGVARSIEARQARFAWQVRSDTV